MAARSRRRSFYGSDLAHVQQSGFGDFANGAAPALLALLRRAGRSNSSGRSAVDAVIASAEAGSGKALAALAETGQWLGIGLAGLVNLFNPSTVFVHSLLFEADPGLFDHIVEEARGRALPPSWADCRVVRAKGNKRQGAVAGIVQHLTNAVAPGLGHL